MAKISITDSPSGKDTLILVQYFEDDGITSYNLDEYIQKSLIKSVLQFGDKVFLNWDGTKQGVNDANKSSRGYDYKDVQLPVVSSVAQLLGALSTYVSNVPSNGVFGAYDTFDNADLDDGNTTFYYDWVHNLGHLGVVAEIRDGSGVNQILTTTEIDDNTLRIDCAGAITGTWSVTGFVKI